MIIFPMSLLDIAIVRPSVNVRSRHQGEQTMGKFTLGEHP